MVMKMKKVKEITPRKWGILAIVIFLGAVIGCALLTVIVDPYFHYHAPIEGISYRLYEQRYINDGISRHFEYDTVITGNSLSENFRTSEIEEVFGGKCVKLSYSGAGYKELWSSLDRTLSYNPETKKVFVIVDSNDIDRGKDYMRYTDYPEYLYDDIIWNDAAYLWNKDIFYRGTVYNLLMTVTGKPSTSFDEYSAKEEETGAREVLQYVKDIPNEEYIELRDYEEESKQNVLENVTANIVPVLEKYPQTKFYIVIAPSSIAKWCSYYRKGQIESYIYGMKDMAQIILQEPNVELYNFQNDVELTCDLNNYRDTIHYSTDVTSYILQYIEDGKFEWDIDNYEEKAQELLDFYTGFDYRKWKSEEEAKIQEE